MNEYYQFHDLDYSFNPETLDQIRSAINDYINMHGKDPDYLLMGYGTYIEMCCTLSTLRMERSLITYKDFEGTPIIIDPEHERRCVAWRQGEYGDPHESASHAFMLAKRKARGW